MMTIDSMPPSHQLRQSDCSSQWATEQSRNGSDQQLSFVDVKKAYVYGMPDRNLYVWFPQELEMPKNMMGKLVRCMYGTRDAGAIWETCYTG